MARTTNFKGAPFELAGPQLKAGDKAPDAVLKKDFVTDMRLSETRGKTRIFSVVPSVDTGVCAAQTKRFNEELAKLDNVSMYTISCDLPPAQKRFCGAEGIDCERMVMLSDHKDHTFGSAYGTYIPKLGFESRAIFVIDKNDNIRYVEYVPEITEHPNYEAALAAVQQAAKQPS